MSVCMHTAANTFRPAGELRPHVNLRHRRWQGNHAHAREEKGMPLKRARRAVHAAARDGRAPARDAAPPSGKPRGRQTAKYVSLLVGRSKNGHPSYQPTGLGHGAVAAGPGSDDGVATVRGHEVGSRAWAAPEAPGAP